MAKAKLYSKKVLADLGDMAQAILEMDARTQKLVGRPIEHICPFCGHGIKHDDIGFRPTMQSMEHNDNCIVNRALSAINYLGEDI